MNALRAALEQRQGQLLLSPARHGFYGMIAEILFELTLSCPSASTALVA